MFVNSDIAEDCSLQSVLLFFTYRNSNLPNYEQKYCAICPSHPTPALCIHQSKLLLLIPGKSASSTPCLGSSHLKFSFILIVFFNFQSFYVSKAHLANFHLYLFSYSIFLQFSPHKLKSRLQKYRIERNSQQRAQRYRIYLGHVKCQSSAASDLVWKKKCCFL